MSTALSLLKVENEDNALLCIKIIIDGFRSHKVSPTHLEMLIRTNHINPSATFIGAN